MSKETLNTALLELHQTLADQPVLNEQEQRLLQELAEEIQCMINNDAPVDKSVAARMEAECIELENEYPALSGALRQLVNTLAAMGI
jgi:hypothetical protein